MPSRVVIDATNLPIGSYETPEQVTLLSSELKLVPKANHIEIVSRESEETIFRFSKRNSNRLKIFTAIASKYPEYASRDEIANNLSISKGKETLGNFYKQKIYMPVNSLNEILKKETKGKLSFDTSKAAKEGFLLKN